MPARSLKETGKRSFTIHSAHHIDGCPTKFSHKDYTGRYTSRDSYGAVSKALTALCHLKDIRGQCTLYIEMRETTQGSKHKVYAYRCKRVKTEKPHILPNGTEQWYVNQIKSIKRVPTEDCPKSHKSAGRMVGHHSKLRHSVRHRTKKTMVNRVSNTMKSAMQSVKKSVKRIL